MLIRFQLEGRTLWKCPITGLTLLLEDGGDRKLCPIRGYINNQAFSVRFNRVKDKKCRTLVKPNHSLKDLCSATKMRL